MGAGALLRAVTDADLRVTAQWRNAGRAFACVSARPA
jgi:hypothetical protein